MSKKNEGNEEILNVGKGEKLGMMEMKKVEWKIVGFDVVVDLDESGIVFIGKMFMFMMRFIKICEFLFGFFYFYLCFIELMMRRNRWE